MKTHLTQEQISYAIVGELPTGARQHLLGCESCRLQVSRFEGELATFGRAIRDWSEAAAQEIPCTDAPRKAGLTMTLPRFAMAGLAAGVLVFGLTLVSSSHSHRSGAQVNSAADAALLTQVDAELARAVPDSMEPLTKLVAVYSPEKTQQ